MASRSGFLLVDMFEVRSGIAFVSCMMEFDSFTVFKCLKPKLELVSITNQQMPEK